MERVLYNQKKYFFKNNYLENIIGLLSIVLH